MIKNERQYKITKAQAAKFERALRQLEQKPDESVHALLRQAEIDGVRSQLEEMNEEIAEYEKLKTRPAQPFVFDGFGEMLRCLTRVRIARGLTQKALGERLQLKEQQIQRYEATDYESASTSRVSEVMDALGVKVAGRSVTLKGDAGRSVASRKYAARGINAKSARAASASAASASRKK